MPRNIEIKARIAGVDALLPRAQALADGGQAPTLIEQDDQFFRVPQGHGRLKLRRFADGSAELIHYQRPDATEVRASDYVRVPVPDADALATALTRALGGLHAVSCGTRQPHFAVAGANGLAGRCLSLDMRR